MRKFIITDEEREEIFRLLKTRSYLGVRNSLLSLDELKEEKINEK